MATMTEAQAVYLRDNLPVRTLTAAWHERQHVLMLATDAQALGVEPGWYALRIDTNRHRFELSPCDPVVAGWGGVVNGTPRR